MDLPKPVIFNIFVYLNDRDSLQFALTCYKMYYIFVCDYLWQIKIMKHDIKEIRSESNKNRYIICKQATEISKLTKKSLSNICNSEHLFIRRHSITKLPNISYLKNITLLICNDNQLSNLDVTSLINLHYLYCSRNQLFNINITGLINLHYLYCYNNLIKLNIIGLNKHTYFYL